MHISHVRDTIRQLRSIKRAIKLSPKEAIYYNYLGTIFDKLRKYDKAIECYKKAIGIEPNANLYRSLGTSLINVKKYDEAIEQLKRP